MNVSDLDLNLLVALDALLRTRSVSLAAMSIGLSQPGMSAALSRLRKLFDDPLFVRTSEGMQPTPRMLELAEPLQNALDLIRNGVLRSSSFDPATTKRAFTFCMSDVCEMMFLPGILKRIRVVAPDVCIQTVILPPLELERALERGEVDLAVGYYPDLQKAGFYQQRLFDHPFVCLASANHPEIGNKLSREQFLEVPHAVVRHEGRALEVFERALQEGGLLRRVVLSIPHYMSIPVVIAGTELIVTVPQFVGKLFARLTGIKVLDLPMESPSVDIRQHWHSRFHNDPAHKWLRGIIAELFSGNDWEQSHPLAQL